MTFNRQPESIRDMLTSREEYEAGAPLVRPLAMITTTSGVSQATVCSCVERPDVYSKSLHESDRVESLDLKSAMSDQTDIQRDRVAGKAGDRTL